MPSNRGRDRVPEPIHNPARTFLADALTELYQADGDEILAFLDVWRALPRRTRAKLAMAVNPDLTDEQVGRLVGRSARQLRRWDDYQGLKITRADLRRSGRYRGFSDPDDPDG